MNGIIILDKSKGITSQRAVTEVKNLLRTKRAGHTGTLDPFATGVLPVCLGEATKLIPFLDEDFKEYEALLRLGMETDTLDATGQVTSKKEVGEISAGDVARVLSKFTGSITQTPPMFSALKKNGVRLYSLAREGKEIERPSRSVFIQELKLLELSRLFIKFFVRCSRGTYVRVLGSDIGAELGCGGHLVELRRVRSGIFSIEDAVSVDDLRGENINTVSMKEALSHIEEVGLKKGAAERIRNGKQIRKCDLDFMKVPRFEKGYKVRVYEGSDFVSIAEAVSASSDLDKSSDGEIVLKLVRVFNLAVN